MCGIAGTAAADPRRIPAESTLRRMAAALAHRGPDGEGIHRGPGIGLAVRRLAIVDREGGGQPLTDESGSLALICNGEIYNAPELRRELERAGHRFRTRSDVEVAVHLYEERGPDFLHQLRGMFALALWDDRERRLLLARDAMGIKPLVWTETAAGLSFASESKALFAAGLVEPAIDPASVDAVFRFGYVVSPRTVFEGVRALLPGERLLYSAGTLRLETWRAPPRASPPRRRRSARHWAEGLRERLVEAVRVHLRSDVPVSTWLSGGLDSSLVTAIAARETGQPLDVHTLTFDDPAFDEVADGTLAQLADLPLRVHPARFDDRSFEVYPQALWHVESPTANLGELPRWVLSESTARSHRVVLAGEGSDELFGGYEWYGLDRLTRPLSRLPLGLRRRMLAGSSLSRRRPWLARAALAPAHPQVDRFAALTGPPDGESRHRLYSARIRARIAEALASGTAPETALRNRATGGSFERLRRMDADIRLPDFIELKLDRASMAHGVEVRVPFLDREVVSYAANIPTGFKLRRFTEKWILRIAAEGLVPDRLRWRAKRGLASPFRRWLREPLPAFAENLLSARALEGKGYFDAREVADRLAKHRAGLADYGNSLAGVLAVQTLDDLFVAGRRPEEAGA